MRVQGDDSTDETVLIGPFPKNDFLFQRRNDPCGRPLVEEKARRDEIWPPARGVFGEVCG